MGEAKARAAGALISVLIPERGRPDMLERLICSLLDTAGDDERIEILVAIDNDDEAWTDREPFQHSRTRYLRRPRPPTLGEKLNMLAGEARGDLLWFIANDQVVETKGWPTILRKTIQALPNHVGIVYPHDPLHLGHASYPVISRRTYETLGFFVPPCYPFWFIDTHMDALGLLLGQHVEAPVTISAPDGRGKCHALVDLPFWVEFFHELAPLRLREATQLAVAAYGQGTADFTEFMRKLAQRQKLCEMRTAHLKSPEFLARWGDFKDSPPSPDYPKVKEYAAQMMADLRKHAPRRPRIAIACPSGRTWEAVTGNCIAAMAAYSTLHGIEIAMLNVQSSDIAHGRNKTVEIAEKEGCDAICWVDSDMRFPPDMLVRLMAHDKPIVGATYCKRVPDPDGRYPVLGKLAGPMPETMNDGLHEALLLPGGLMFVRMEVYRALGWPYYAMAYRFPGADGLEAFKGLLRNYFSECPPEEALSELDGTKLGDWLRTGYLLGENGEMVPSLSEDLWFCRRSRRAGFSVFADIKLTGECAHLGELPVTCLLGPEIVRLPAAAE